ncbi:zf-TFIIB domain-containing protein [Streptomyces sp. SID14515]|uniref:TFIIB-type zinc ribbon-containing protein n=1 Tax=Streptomyces sp. SID14515 TaxID=2706074 RepID=UPI0013CA850A|nr:zf-TFIIB domain-containing protein [Streptomyces sp. SID14515]NEB37904.1 zf-TFIIB domain-containing protein [Streptomyces sp. SID14515]
MMQCPKCHAQMNTYNRNGVQIEQCSGCRGIFLDYGELESLTRLESQWSQQAPPAPPAPGGYPAPPAPQAYPAAPAAHAPAWGAPQHGGHYGHRSQKGFGRMLFSS